MEDLCYEFASTGPMQRRDGSLAELLPASDARLFLPGHLCGFLVLVRLSTAMICHPRWRCAPICGTNTHVHDMSWHTSTVLSVLQGRAAGSSRAEWKSHRRFFVFRSHLARGRSDEVTTRRVIRSYEASSQVSSRNIHKDAASLIKRSG